MANFNVEQEFATRLLNEASDLTSDEPATMIAWYDALLTQDKARFLTGLARWQGQLQIDNYLVLRISHTMMGVLHRDELLKRGENAWIAANKKLPSEMEWVEVKMENGDIILARLRDTFERLAGVTEMITPSCWQQKNDEWIQGHPTHWREVKNETNT